MAGYIFFALLCVVATAVFVLLILPHNLRVKRAREAAKDLTPQDREEILAMIRAACTERRWGTMWIRSPKQPDADDLLLGSHLAGEPYAEKGEVWPPSVPEDPEDSKPRRRDEDGEGEDGEDEDEEDPRSVVPAPFLLQVRLGDRSLGPVWPGRLLTVFLQEDTQQVVRSYKEPSRQKYVKLEGGPEKVDPVPLEELPIPAEVEAPPQDKDVYVEPGPADYSPRAFLERVPGLKERLERHFSDAQGLLTQILLPGSGYDLEASSVIYQGKEASYIQNPHEARCSICKAPLRFLFQFGDLVPGTQLGDAGVGYVYGCDGHPDACVGFIDSH